MTDTILAVIRERGPAWDPKVPMHRQKMWEEHAAFMNALVADGVVVLGGPLGEGERVLLAMRAEDDRDVHRRLAGDPWSKRSLLITASIDAWTILLDGRETPRPAAG